MHITYSFTYSCSVSPLRDTYENLFTVLNVHYIMLLLYSLHAITLLNAYYVSVSIIALRPYKIYHAQYIVPFHI